MVLFTNDRTWNKKKINKSSSFRKLDRILINLVVQKIFAFTLIIQEGYFH